VTFKDLQKAIKSQQSGPEQSLQLLQKLRDKPFWISDPSKHKEKIGQVKEFAALIT
jgi:hypothetical protein